MSKMINRIGEPYNNITTTKNLPETNSWPMKIGLPKWKLIFQPSIFRCENVGFRDGTSHLPWLTSIPFQHGPRMVHPVPFIEPWVVGWQECWLGNLAILQDAAGRFPRPGESWGCHMAVFFRWEFLYGKMGPIPFFGWNGNRYIFTDPWMVDVCFGKCIL